MRYRTSLKPMYTTWLQKCAKTYLKPIARELSTQNTTAPKDDASHTVVLYSGVRRAASTVRSAATEPAV